MWVKRSTSLLTVVLAALLSAPEVAADDVSKSGRRILETHQDAVVTVLLVIKQKVSFPGMASQESESKVEATGTVVSAEGLTLVSLSQTDPSSIMQIIMEGQGRGDLQMETEIRDVQIMLTDGTEVPAEIILRDQDLDMAFARPLTPPDAPFAFIDLSKTGEPQYLDQIITLNRLGKVAGRVHSASIERIEAIVEKPRVFYIPGNDATNTGLGSPAFTLDGDFIGTFLLRAIKSTGGGRSRSMFGGASDNMLSILVPAEDIAYAVEQAPPFKE